jgi:bacillithiol system protein YtxJ
MDRLRDREHAEALITGAAPAWILKHSAICPTSHAAHAEVEQYLAAHPGEAAAVVVVQEDRPLSNWLSERLGRVHQSPQLFLLHGGRVAWATSHWSITASAMAAERAKLG